jgi:cysteine desulfurase family protein (TIGR01976 family)
MLDSATIRAQFPALQRTYNGQSVIYADNPGGTQVPQSVADAMSDYLLHRNANVHGTFLTSKLTDETIESARSAMADLLNAPSTTELVFGANMTTLTFQVMHSLARTLQHGDEVVVTTLDHDANYTPWMTLLEHGAHVRQVPFNVEDGTLDQEQFVASLNERTRIVAFGHASNALGTLSPVTEMVKIVRAHAPNALIFIDAVQSVPHVPVDVQAIGADMLACSAYKFFGPHMGILWGRSDLLAQLPAYKVRPAYATAPDKFETGTKNHEGMAGVAAAVNHLAGLVPENGNSRRERLKRAMRAVQAHEQELSRRLLRGLTANPNVTVYGLKDIERVGERVPTVAINLKGVNPEQVAHHLAEEGIFCWSGHYYALEVMEGLGLVPHGALRLGFAHYNTPEEVDRVVETISGIS